MQTLITPGYKEMTNDRADIFTKEILENGKETIIKCAKIGDQIFRVDGGPLSIIRLEDEWHEDVSDPYQVIETLRGAANLKADLFSFWQRLPDSEPMYDFYRESEGIAALPVCSYDYWWSKQIRSNTRAMIRKAKKVGVEVRETEYTDEFVRGMHDIFNETPVRQGRSFWHYGRPLEEIKRNFSRYLFRERLFGAYHNEELIGFIFLEDAGRYATLGQILSKISQRDKAPNNILIAKAVEVCADNNIPYLVYAYWPEPGSLAEFKKHSGFTKIDLPRYYVPLTLKGELALRCGAHRGWKTMVPPRLKDALKRVRSSWYERRAG